MPICFLSLTALCFFLRSQLSDAKFSIEARGRVDRSVVAAMWSPYHLGKSVISLLPFSQSIHPSNHLTQAYQYTSEYTTIVLQASGDKGEHVNTGQRVWRR